MFSRVLNLKSSHDVASCYSVLCDQSPFPYGIAIDLSSPKEAKYFLLEGVPLVGRAIKTWLYMGIYAVLRRSARCSRSAGGVVAIILLLRAFGSICRIVSITVSCMFLPR
jgi:hypothetical protein